MSNFWTPRQDQTTDNYGKTYPRETKVTGSSSRSQASSKPCLALLLTLVALIGCSGTAQGYFMTCDQFCSRMANDQFQRVICIYNMCRSGKLGHKIVRFAKRESELHLPAYNVPKSPSLADLIVNGSSTGTAAGSERDHSDSDVKSQLSKSVIRGATLLQALSKARNELAVRRPLPPVQEKRDPEYWDGPAPADMNA